MRRESFGRRATTILVAVLVLIAGCARDDGPAATTPTAPPADPALANTATGTVRGTVAPDHRLFAGIPYAAPPVGPLRWQPPAPAQSWPGVRDATHTGPRCMQDGSDLEMGRQTSEDCLTLNVWTPPPSDAKRAVMVWIHGGAFINGSSGIYDSRWLATRGDVVVVTLNYRLGALGFLAHPALGPPGAVGNYGLADQQAALRWVHDNIANFGGDPDAVTIAGESAGGMSVCDHLVAPGSEGLFRAAIIQSGPCQAQLALPDAQRASVDYARAAGCGDMRTVAACLRALPAEKLRKPVWYYRIGDDALSGPVTGTKVLPVDPMTEIAEGRAAKVPVLIGTNHDEFTLFVALEYLRQKKPYTEAQYPQLLAQTFGRHAAEVATHYPLSRYGGSVPLAYSAAVTDGVFACVADRITEGLAKEDSVYAYEFDDRGAPAPDPLRNLPFPVGASHSLELRYLFDIGGAPPLNPDQRVLSDQMIDAWSQFVRDGHPGDDWPAFDAQEKRLSLRPDGSRVDTNFDQARQCPFWAGLEE
ncbi:carboxylesterase family protein [Mycobacterium hodleri]|uniref:carboxylesterase/lipase family protein n=1 Tax=Mycolicibacterium hodleri TaxID=49897 RepID=UPI0021F2CCAD|nr:carboxylesterase/lipase family protein [Mycolicibacterium hodleri]MCV7131671.1 carboxylesterase family protein [Mycolicibacterium hodleri]